MGKTFGSRNSPIADQAFFVATICFPYFFARIVVGDIIRFDFRILSQVRQLPCGRTVGDEGIRQQDNRSHMFERQFSCPISGIEAVCRSRSGNHDSRAFTVTSIERLHQVGLFALGRHTRRRTATLHIDNDQRQFGNHSQTDRFALQRQTGTGCGSRSQATGKAGTDRSTDSGNFIFRLNGDNAEFLMFRQFMQNIGGRSNRVASEEQPQAGLLGGGDQPIGSSLVPVHVSIKTRCSLLTFDTVSGD